MPSRRSPRKKPAQDRSRETVKALVTAAARILEQDGYERASVNRIAKLAGVSVGSLYQYFPTKEALAAAVGKQLGEDMIAVFSEGLPAVATLSIDEAIVEVVGRAVRAFRLNPRLREVITSQLPEALMGTAEFDAWLATAIEAYLVFHREKVRPTDPRLAATILISSVESAARAASLHGDPDDALTRELAELVRGYLVAR